MEKGLPMVSKAFPMVTTDADIKAALRKRKRPIESIIQTLLFLCGAVSILTTLGIAYGLATESLNFFTTELWEDVNKRIITEINSQTTNLHLSSGGFSLDIGSTIKIDDEKMLVQEITPDSITVERGYANTVAVSHNLGTNLFASTRVSLIEFFTGTNWNPQIGQFGIWPLVTSTLRTSLLAVVVAMPLGLSVAIYLSEYATPRARSILKPILEVLSGIPTVVYGYFALMFMTQLLRSIFGADTVQIYNTASAGIVIGILILPLVSSMSEDALRAVPRSLREAAYGMGATKWETAVKVVVPAALSGITAAFMVSISRAIGETMVVAIAAGAGPNFTFNPFDSAETMTGHIVRISGGDLSYDSIDYNSIFAIGLMLFLMTLGLNILSQRIVRKFREVYE
ncbi:MAG: phosphate ABC transporter permease subunit PstC [Anaerolineae bacterium]|nr:phosphate ABC transporter permease subunit PstC [Anaerolineae bacterium]